MSGASRKPSSTEKPACSLGAAIRRLVGDAELRRTLAERGRRLVLARYTAEHMTRAFRKLYDEVLR